MAAYHQLGGILVPSFHAEGYDASRTSLYRRKNAGVRAFARDEDRHIGEYDRSQLRLECMYLRRNNPTVAAICERFADNVVGPGGIKPQAKTSSNEWNEAAESYYLEWQKVADYGAGYSMREIQRLAVQSRIISGECAFVMVGNGQLQSIEAERIATPNKFANDAAVIDGIRIGADGRMSGMYVCNRDRSGFVDTKDFDFVDARDVVHVYRPIRFDQRRGIPEIAPVITTLLDQADLNEAILAKARINAKRAAVVETADGAQTIGQLGPRNVTAQGDDTGRVHEEFNGILTYYLRKGEKASEFGSDTPGATYGEHNAFLTGKVCQAISIPPDFLTMSFTSGSFGSNRVALQQTYRTFENWQAWMIERFLQRVWNWRIAKAIKARELPPAPVDARGYSEWYKVLWVPPEYTWVDPNKEADAELKRYNLCTETITSLNLKKGRDAMDVMREKARDLANAEVIAKEVNAEFGTTLTRDDIIGTKMPGQGTPSAAPAENGVDANAL